MEALHCTKEQAQAELSEMLTMPDWSSKGPVREPAQFTVEETLVRFSAESLVDRQFMGCACTHAHQLTVSSDSSRVHCSRLKDQIQPIICGYRASSRCLDRTTTL